jgi:hypothetical protein
MTTDQAVHRASALKAAGFIVRWFDVQRFEGVKPAGSSRAALKGTFWSFIAQKNKKNVDWVFLTNVKRSSASSMIASYRNIGYRVKQIETLQGTDYAMLLVKETGNTQQATLNLTKSQHQHQFNHLGGQGYRLIQGGNKYAPADVVNGISEFAGWERYALYEKDGHSTWSKHSLDMQNMKILFDFKATQGYYLTDLDVFSGMAIPYYVSGMGKPAQNGGKPINTGMPTKVHGMVFKKGVHSSKGVLKTGMSEPSLIAQHNQLASQGYVMALCVSYNDGGLSPVHTALWRKPGRVKPTDPGPGPGRPDGPGGFKPNSNPNDPNAIPPRPRKPTRNPRIPNGPGGLKSNPNPNDLDAIPPRHVDPKRNPRIPQGPNGIGTVRRTHRKVPSSRKPSSTVKKKKPAPRKPVRKTATKKKYKKKTSK